ncbi:MAG: hypothetical protein ACYDDQ_14400 [Vulcanimicrobiaceae bacterium]
MTQTMAAATAGGKLPDILAAVKRAQEQVNRGEIFWDDELSPCRSRQRALRV